MTSSYDEEALRHWLADYLVTTVGCSPYDIDFDAPMSDLGLGSRDAVVLSGELSELLGRKVSPVEFWQHPTIADLARFLTGAERDAEDEARARPQSPRRAGRGHRSGLPVARWDLRPGRVLAVHLARAGTRSPRCRRNAGRRSTTAPPRSRRRWRTPPASALHGRPRRLRRRVLRHLRREAAKMDPQQRMLARSRLGGTGTCGHSAELAAPLADRGLRRRLLHRLRVRRAWI